MIIDGPREGIGLIRILIIVIMSREGLAVKELGG
jgi:hypothetical protein